MKSIQIFGEPNPRRDRLEQRLRTAAQELEMEVSIEICSDPEKWRELGIRLLPAFWLNGLPKTAGQVPEVSELQDYLCGLDAMPKSSDRACGLTGCL